MKLMKTLPTPSRWKSPNIKTSARVYFVAAVLAFVLGVATILIGERSSGSVTSVLFLPGALILLFSFVLAGRHLNDIILVSRASLDLLLNYTRVSSGGLGLGGAINLIVILAASRLLFQKDARYRQGFVVWIPFLIIAALSMIQTPDKLGALKAMIALLTSFAAFVTGRSLVIAGEHSRLVSLIMIGSAISFMLSLSFMAVGRGYITETDGGIRFSGIFGHSNILAFFCVINSALALYVIEANIYSSPIKIVLLRSHLLIAILLLIATRTRSAWASELVLFLGYAFFFKRRYFVYLGVVMAIALCIPEVQERVFGIFSTDGYRSGAVANSYEWRLLLWHDALHSLSILDYFFGRGLAAFFYYSSNFFTLAGGLSWGAHSIFVQLIYEVGLIGLAAFSMILLRFAYIFLASLRVGAQKNDAAIGLFLVSMYIFVGYSDNMFNYVVFNYYFFALLGAFIGRVSGSR